MSNAFDDLFNEPRPRRQPVSLVGQQVGSYHLEELLAESLYCQVYRAQDRELLRPAAIKILKAGPWLSDRVRDRFKREGRVLAQLRHPHLVPFYGLESINGQPCLVMEFVPDGTLADRLTGMPVRMELSLALIQQILRALSAAHRRHVVHRDLKPQNILLDQHLDDPDWETEWGFVKLTDFGIAKMLDDFESLTLTGSQQPGTPAYMAPEQIEGRKSEIGMATDLHAIGIITYLLLTGRNPFEGTTLPATLKLVSDFTPPPPSKTVPDIPAWLDEWCMKCLAKAPEDRYPDALRALQALQQHASPPSAERPSLEISPRQITHPVVDSVDDTPPKSTSPWFFLGLAIFLVVAALYRMFL